MALLERIQSMKQSGLNDTQIVNTLKEEGFSPLEINEAISQSKIKAAVSGEGDSSLQQSVMPPANNEVQTVGTPESMNQQTYQEPPVQQEPVYNQGAYPADQYQQQPGYDTTQGTYYQQAIDLETVRDISRQETDEALKKVREQLNSLEKMKSEMKFEMQDIENRLIRVESVIDEIQSAIIKKIGEYGTAISNISQEVRATQNSFSKILNPVLDKKRGISSSDESQLQPTQAQQQQNPPQKQKAPNKPSPRSTSNNPTASVEDYFR